MAAITHTRRLPASTLVEVIIAMVITVTVFGIAIGIYTNVTQSGYPVSKVQSEQQMQQIVQESMAARDWQDQELTEDSILYRKTVTSWPGYDDLLLIEVQAIQQEKALGSHRRIVRKEDPSNE